MKEVNFSTPTQPTLGVSTFWSEPTTILTLHRKVATRMASISPCRGFATTTGMTRVMLSTRKRSMLLPKAQNLRAVPGITSLEVCGFGGSTRLNHRHDEVGSVTGAPGFYAFRCRHQLSISSSVRPLVSGTSRHTNRNAATQITA